MRSCISHMNQWYIAMILHTEIALRIFMAWLQDGAVFYHWRRAADEGQDYPFARFNKVSRISW